MSPRNHEETGHRPTDRRALLAGIGGLAAGSFLTAGRAQAGLLIPPAAPDSTPGPEPRIAINAQNTPGDATAVYRITEPGSYYLESNVTGEAGKNGIVIAASNVWIDLGGFAMVGVVGSLAGIATSGTRNQLQVHNGIIRQWGGGGINLPVGGFGRDGVIEDVTAVQNTSVGIAGADNSIIRRCVVSSSSNIGISVRFRSLVSDCTVGSNTGTGIIFGGESSIVGCLCTDNNVGIAGGPNGTVASCKAQSNSNSGFNVGDTCIIRDCIAIGNAGSAGILVGGGSNIVDGNICIGNDRGIESPQAGNLITRNVCRGNTTANWQIAAGNKCFVVPAASSGAINGDSGGVSLGTTDPNANYTF